MRSLSVDDNLILELHVRELISHAIMWLFVQRVLKVNSLSAYLSSVVLSVSYSTRLGAIIKRYDIHDFWKSLSHEERLQSILRNCRQCGMYNSYDLAGFILRPFAWSCMNIINSAFDDCREHFSSAAQYLSTLYKNQRVVSELIVSWPLTCPFYLSDSRVGPSVCHLFTSRDYITMVCFICVLTICLCISVSLYISRFVFLSDSLYIQRSVFLSVCHFFVFL